MSYGQRTPHTGTATSTGGGAALKRWHALFFIPSSRCTFEGPDGLAATARKEAHLQQQPRKRRQAGRCTGVDFSFFFWSLLLAQQTPQTKVQQLRRHFATLATAAAAATTATASDGRLPERTRVKKEEGIKAFSSSSCYAQPALSDRRALRKETPRTGKEKLRALTAGDWRKGGGGGCRSTEAALVEERRRRRIKERKEDRRKKKEKRRKKDRKEK